MAKNKQVQESKLVDAVSAWYAEQVQGTSFGVGSDVGDHLFFSVDALKEELQGFSEDADMEKAVSAWVHRFLHNSVMSQNTELWNAFSVKLPLLVQCLKDAEFKS